MTFLANAIKCSINGNIVICYCELYCLWDNNNNTNMGTVCVLIGLLLIKVLLFCCYWSV